jgi:AcrR family transcriptional regulator
LTRASVLLVSVVAREVFVLRSVIVSFGRCVLRVVLTSVPRSVNDAPGAADDGGEPTVRNLIFVVLLAEPVAGVPNASPATSRPTTVPDRNMFSSLMCVLAGPAASVDVPPHHATYLPVGRLASGKPKVLTPMAKSGRMSCCSHLRGYCGKRMPRTPTYSTAEGRATRDAILDAAVNAFAARGYRGASIDQIAAEVGVSRQGVLHHFPSKVKLLIAVLDRRDEQDIAHSEQLQASESMRLVDAVKATQDYRAERRGLAQLYTILSAESVDTGHPAHEYFVDRYRRIRALFVEFIGNAQAEGRVGKELSPETLSIALIALLDGLQLQDQIEHEAFDAEQVLSDLLDFFVKD